jgi:hypothetical protein
MYELDEVVKLLGSVTVGAVRVCLFVAKWAIVAHFAVKYW